MVSSGKSSDRDPGYYMNLKAEERMGDPMMPPTLAAYGPLFRDYQDDDVFKFRLLAHEFGLLWESTRP